MSIAALPLFHRIAGQPVIVLGEGEAAEAKRRLIERAGGLPIGDEDAPAALAFVALDAPEAAVARLRARGVLVNAVDRPDLCDFTVPSILDRAPVMLAIGTGGASAGLAKALRLRLEALLPQTLGALASALGAARPALRGRFPDAGERRRALDAALGEGGALDVLRDRADDAVAAWLAGAPAAPAAAVEIALRSDDPEDLTLREARLLGSADVLAHEAAVPAIILDRARADAARVALAPGAPPPAAVGLVVVLRASAR
ncbi:MAG TPA: NAD(P)-dependent oxidoreductase [Novosphingobium sp.]